MVYLPQFFFSVPGKFNLHKLLSLCITNQVDKGECNRSGYVKLYRNQEGAHNHFMPVLDLTVVRD